MRVNFNPVKMRLCLLWLILAPSAPASDLIADYQPSSIESEYGPLSRVEFSTGVIKLGPHLLVHSPAGTMRDFRFSEPVWVLGYKSTILDPDGNAPRDNYLCHTFFGDQRVVQRQDQRMRAFYSDGFTPEIRLPEGFGVPFTPRDNLHWMPMFNNRADAPVQVEMRVDILLIRAKDLKKPLRQVYSTLRSVQLPHLFYIPPQRNGREITFQFPFDCRIHFAGTHIHPHGESIELFNVSRQERVWKGAMKTSDQPARMEVYSSAAGYPVHAGETFRLSSVYNNPTGRDIDAMAAIFLFFSIN